MGSEKIDMSTLFTTNEAADFIGITPGRVSQLVRGGKIPGVIIKGPRCVLIPKKSAEKIKSSPSPAGRPRSNSQKSQQKQG